jgi:chromosome segregation ATPase
MKNIRLLRTSILLAIVLTTFSCQTSSEKLENAKTEADKANTNLDEANKEYLADLEKFKKESTAKISENEQSIIAFKARIANSKQEAKADYDKKISDLSQKNRQLKRKLDEFRLEGKEQWESFKTEFSRDMNELGNAFKDFGNNNVD